MPAGAVREIFQGICSGAKRHEMRARQHPAPSLARQLDEAKVPIECGSLWGFGIYHQGGDSQRGTGSRHTLTSIRQQNSPQPLAMMPLMHSQTAK